MNNNNSTIINNSLDLGCYSTSCNDKCVEIFTDISSYIKESSSNEEFALAALQIKDYQNFESFFNVCIGSSRKSDFNKARKNGYYTRILTTEERNNRLDELFSIHTSTKVRQGEMKYDFLKYPEVLLDNNCDVHFQKTFGVFTPNDEWIGYISPRFCGEFVRTYQIMGHAGHFGKINFMVLLMFDFIKYIYEYHPETKYILYHYMYVGNQGLQDWKKNVGFKPARFIGKIIKRDSL